LRNNVEALENKPLDLSLFHREIPTMAILLLTPFVAYFNAYFLFLPLIWIGALLSRIEKKNVKGVSRSLFLSYFLAIWMIAYHFYVAKTQIAIDEIRHYLGFIFIYPALSSIFRNRPYELKSFFVWMGMLISIVHIAEGILINCFPILLEILGNYPDVNVHISYATRVLGFYVRPMGLGVHHSGTATLIVVLLTLASNLNDFVGYGTLRKMRLLANCAVILSFSGTGFAFLLMHMGLRIFRSRWKKVAIVPLGVILLTPVIVIFIPGFDDRSPLWKISAPYILFLVDLKVSSLSATFIPNGLWNLFWGIKSLASERAFTWTDFALGSFLNVFGLSGIVLHCAFAFRNMNRFTIVPLLMLALSTLHYSALFTPLGQMVFVMLLLVKPEADNLPQNQMPALTT